MTDVLLVNPKSINVLPSYLPYGLLYIAAVLREKGVRVKIYDSNTMFGDFASFVRKEKPKIIGISILSGPCLSDAVEKAKEIREILPKVKIIFGGIHTTIFPKEVLQNDYVDFVVINEGEFPIWELSEYLLKGRGTLSKIKNLGYKKGKKLFLNPIRPFIDLNSLPLPAWDLLPMEKYIHKKFYSNKVVTLHTSRGCPWNCAYCYNQAVNFRRWRGISAEKIIEQIEFLQKNYHIEGFQFYDDEFDANPKRVVEFCNLILEKGLKIKWAHYSRTNVADKERYILEKKAGCEFIEFGVESGSPRILKMIQKQQTVDNIRNAFKICREVGLKSGAMFMIGLPTETKKEIEATVKLVNSLGAHQTINTIFHPYPGSFLFDMCLKKRFFRLPSNLEDQGPYFDIGNTDINVSDVPVEYLQKVNSYFYFKNITSEIKLCLSKGNFPLLFYYLKKLFNSNILNAIFEKSLFVLRLGKKVSKIDEKTFYSYLGDFAEVLSKYKLGLADFLKHSRSYNWGTIEFLRKIEEKTNQGDRLLEVGVGMGFLSFILSREGYQIDGLEVEKPTEHDPTEKNPTREKYREKIWSDLDKKTKVEIKFYDGCHLPFEEEVFDGVVFDGVLEHVHPQELPVLLKEVRRVLKKGGRVFVSRCPNSHAYAEKLARLLYGYGHYRLFSENYLTEEFRKAKFKVEKIKTTDFFLNFFPDPWMKFYNQIFPFTNVIERLIMKTPISVFAHNYEIIASK